MLIRRCAWHPQYDGRARWKGLTSWRGWRIEFTDNICAWCAARFLAEYRVALERRAAARPTGDALA